LNKFAEKFEQLTMEILERKIEMIHIPSMDAMKKMSNYELFEIASRYESFRKLMMKFISSFEMKAVPLYSYDPEGKYNVRNLGLNIRLKNVLLQNDFEYLSDLSYVTKADLFRMKNFGTKSYEELIEVMDFYAIKLADNKKNQPNE
jgi:DNA-directed RNA polymerase alpha subunit